MFGDAFFQSISVDSTTTFKNDEVQNKRAIHTKYSKSSERESKAISETASGNGWNYNYNYKLKFF